MIIYKDDTKCIIDYNHLMHWRRFVRNLGGLLLDAMPTVKAVKYYCFTTYAKDCLPNETDLPGITFTYNSSSLSHATIEMLKVTPFEEPTILVVNIEDDET